MSKQELMKVIQTGKPSEIINSPEVATRFIDLYKTIHGITNDTVATAFYTAEKFHFLKIVNDNPKIKACTNLSLYGIFMDVAVSGLSFDPSMKHLYVVPFNTNVGTKDNAKWEKRASLQISGYGELLLRQLQGQVKYADNPILVYEGDQFAHGTKNGKTVVEHMAQFPRQSDNIIACYLKITRYDDSVDFKVLSIDEVMKLREFSKDKDSLAWTSGLPGMVIAKTIKHAFKNYPKVRIGEFSKLHSETVDTPIEGVEDMAINYGIEEEVNNNATNTSSETNTTEENTITGTHEEELDF